ncbi:micronuclear linker histone polyprotein-like isoform X2 [Argopecten irradians]|uniref:micronuclear linker histone polyprotein-like isoform X2 n=1 Tax=Argopecten irradians TaxID=31199 RepID=UPI00371D8E33
MDPPPTGHDEKDDIELVRAQPDTPSLKKSRSLGGSLKKLFRRGRKRSRDRGETSRESSYSRSSTRNASQGPSREGSITRGTSSSLTRSGQLPDQKGEIGRSHWSKSNTTSNEYLERGIDVSPRHQQMDTTYPVLQQEPAVIQPRGMSSHEADVGRGHWSRPKSGEQLDVARHSYDTHSAPPETEDVRRGHWSKSKSPPRSGTVVITTPKKEPLDVVTPSYDTMAAPPEDKMEVRRSHWSKSKSPGRSVGGVVITKPKHEVPDVVSSSSAKVTAPEVKEEIKEVEVKSQSMEKIDNVDSTEDNVSPPELSDDVRKGHWSKSKTPVHYGPVIIKKKESMEIDVSDKTETTTDASSVQPEVRRGYWSKSKSPSRERDRIGQIVVSNAPVTAAPHAEVDIRKGHWTKSKSRSPKRESFPTVSPGTSVPDNQTF